MVKRLIRKRVLERSRLLDKYYLIAIDGTGYLGFKKRHCKKCLVSKKEEKVEYYNHNILEAELIFENGLELSIETEFKENDKEGYDKQDCELRAFYKMSKRLKKKFPQLKICLSLDGLYETEPLIKVCKENNWIYIITFKEGRMRVAWEEFEMLKRARDENYGENSIR